MDALKSIAKTYPSSFACSLLFYAFYARDAQTAKKKQKIKTEFEFALRGGAREGDAWIGRGSPPKVQSDCNFF
jgi:hypothetical protein